MARTARSAAAAAFIVSAAPARLFLVLVIERKVREMGWLVGFQTTLGVHWCNHPVCARCDRCASGVVS